MISRGPYAIDATPERRPEENQAARNRPAFDCVACGERVARRDTIALHRQLPYHHVRACVKIKFWAPHAIDAM